MSNKQHDTIPGMQKTPIQQTPQNSFSSQDGERMIPTPFSITRASLSSRSRLCTSWSYSLESSNNSTTKGTCRSLYIVVTEKQRCGQRGKSTYNKLKVRSPLILAFSSISTSKLASNFNFRPSLSSSLLSASSVCSRIHRQRSDILTSFLPHSASCKADLDRCLSSESLLSLPSP